ncbi:MAG: insulinase family protein [Fimbriimonadaceae bacterium]|nr:insulinase family protein [Fimbriimonadaceae bacterium]
MSTLHEVRYDSGLTLLIEELERPAVALQLHLPGGSSLDPAGLEGAGTVLSSLVQRGAGGKSTRELSEAFDALGFRRGVGVSQSGTVLSLSGLASGWREAFGLLTDILRRPALANDELEPCRLLAQQTLTGLEDDPGHKLLVETTRRYFPGPFGRCRLGTPEGLAALTPAALQQHWQQAYVPDRAILAVAGGVQAAAVRAAVEELLGDWRGAAPAAPAITTTGRPRYEHVTQTTEQVHLAVAYPDVPPGDPRRYHAMMAVQVLSGGMGSRLFTEVREKRGLCYSVHARSQTLPGCAWVLATAGTTTERSSETLEVLAGELLRLPGTVTADELERGRVRLLSGLIMGDESTASRAARLVNDQLLLGRVRSFDEIRAGVEAVTADSLNDHLGACPPADFTVITLGSEFTWPAALSL